MLYLLMIYADEGEWAGLSEDEQNAVREKYRGFAQRAREDGKLLGGDELQPTDRATTVRLRNDEVVLTDGPYEVTREALGGFFVVDTDSIDDAVELARQLPAPRTRGGVEVRPLYVDESEAS
ncbi:MAG TPA: YciI family protein [Gaiellaceae bacterium]|nr:YciI family protein [Gaiellaceae bacterium]